MIAAELMEAEIWHQIGAGRGEVSEARSTDWNGHRPRLGSTIVVDGVSIT
jgi:hypothetical protein